MNKKDRELVFNKFGGKCAYCGCNLQKGWHVDEIEPCRRMYKNERRNNMEGWKRIFVGYENPSALHIDNQMPSCPSCNINKHSESLEQFRLNIAGYMKHLNEINTQYKMAKKYGLVQETSNPVQFYFETYKM